jgi:peptidoglycan hydrolase-like protein with peptidoglycan-binding domain
MSWGAPKSVSFEKRHIRMVVVDHHRLKVHRSLAPIVERILLDLAEQGLTAETSGWSEGKDGREFRIVVEGMTPEQTDTAMGTYGFKPIAGDGAYRWGAENPPEEPEPAPEPQTGKKVPTRTPVSKPVVPVAPTGHQRLGSRPLALGDEGLDVLTLQVFLGAPRTGIFDDSTENVVRQYHERKGFSSNGTMTLFAFGWIIPRSVERLRTGAAGLTVRLLSSALIAKGELPIDSKVDTRYTVALANAVRDYRMKIGLPRSEVVDSPTWASLVDQPRS